MIDIFSGKYATNIQCGIRRAHHLRGNCSFGIALSMDIHQLRVSTLPLLRCTTVATEIETLVQTKRYFATFKNVGSAMAKLSMGLIHLNCLPADACYVSHCLHQQLIAFASDYRPSYRLPAHSLIV